MVAGLRSLLPDRPLLPRRRPARRPAAGVHPDRPRGVVRRRRRTSQAVVSGCWSTLWAEAGVEVARPFPRIACRGAWNVSASTSPTCATGSSSRDLTPLIGMDAAAFLAEVRRRRAGGCGASCCPAARRSPARTSTRSTAAAKDAKARRADLARRTTAGWEGQGGQGGRPDAARRARRVGRRPAPRRGRGRTPSRRPALTRCGARSRAGSSFVPSRSTPSSGWWTSRSSSVDPRPAATCRRTIRSRRRIRTTCRLLETRPGADAALHYDAVTTATSWAAARSVSPTPSLQRRIFELLGLSEAEVRRRFGFLLDGLSAGAPPHGGFALGFDRITMLLAGRRPCVT